MDASDPGISYNVACSYALLGESDRALDLLEKAVDCGSGFKAWVDHDADRGSLSQSPRFEALLARL